MFSTISMAIPLTQQIIEQLFCRNASAIFPYLCSDIVWIDDIHLQSLYGYYQVREHLVNFSEDLPASIIHHHYHLSAAASSVFIVTGHCHEETKADGTTTACSQYRLTFVWKTETYKIKLIYVHIYPAVFSSLSNVISFHGKHAQTYLVAADDILYIEAENMNCCIYCKESIYHVSHPINQLETVMPNQFLRIHRGFIVNRQYVSTIRRYVVQLNNGCTLPIPEKKYMEVLRKMEEPTIKLP